MLFISSKLFSFSMFKILSWLFDQVEKWLDLKDIPRSIVLYSLFLQVEGYQYILKLSCRPLDFTTYKAFLRRERGLELVSLPHFLRNFEKKYFSSYILLTYQVSLSCCLYFVRYCHCLLSRLWRHKTWN